MQAQPVEGKSLRYFLVRPADYRPDARYPLVVLLHGFGASMEDLVGICPALDTTGYLFACPNAPFAVDLGGGALGYSWSRELPGSPPAPSDGPTTEELLEGFLADVLETTGVEPGSLVLGGFSQGGGLTLRFGLPRPGVFTGLAVLSGALRQTDELLDHLPPRPDQPVFIGHGVFDPMVAIERGRATRDFLESHGYRPEYHEYQMGHEISEREISDLSAWLRAVLPPARV